MSGIVGASVARGSADEASDGSAEAGSDESAEGLEVPGRGEVLVGPLLMNSVMSSGVFCGVTLSMNLNAGRRRTVVLWSEWLGTGMSEAESISFWET